MVPESGLPTEQDPRWFRKEFKLATDIYKQAAQLRCSSWGITGKMWHWLRLLPCGAY